MTPLPSSQPTKSRNQVPRNPLPAPSSSRFLTNTGARVAPEHLPYIEHWDTMCYEILRSNLTGKWDGPFTKMLETEANISSMEEALAVVEVIRNADFEQVLEAHASPS